MPLLVDIRKLTVINSLIQESSQTVAQYLESLSGLKADIEVTGADLYRP